MGRAVYGTPQMMSYSQPRTAFHIMRDTCMGHMHGVVKWSGECDVAK